jgi:outer membrane protein OmpU
MKKILLGSTALAATLVSGAAMAESPIELKLGGYFQAYGIVQDTDQTNLQSTYITQRGRIFVKGSTTLDNGITVGVFTAIRAGEAGNLNNANGLIKKAYGYFEGSFGLVQIGDADGAATQMGYTSPDPAPASGVNSANYFANPAPYNIAGALGSTPTTYQNWDAQNTKIAYFTPRMSGFQFGASYTPSSCYTGPTAGGNSCPSLGTAPSDNTAEKQSEVYQFGVNYTNVFGGVGTDVSATYVTATNEVAGQTVELFNDANDVTTSVGKDRESYSFGINLSYENFTLGGSYLHDNKGLVSNETDAWDLGLKYTMGAFSVGVQHIESTSDFTDSLLGGREDSVKATMIGAGYKIGPGVNLGLGVQDWSWDSTKDTGLNYNTDAKMILIGTVLNF